MTDLFSIAPIFTSAFMGGILIVGLATSVYLFRGALTIWRSFRGRCVVLAVTGTLTVFGKVEAQPRGHYYHDLRLIRDEDGLMFICDRLRLGTGLDKTGPLQYGNWGTWFFMDNRGPGFKNAPPAKNNHYKNLSLLAYWDGENLHQCPADLTKLPDNEGPKIVVAGLVGFGLGIISIMPPLTKVYGEEPALLAAVGCGLLVSVLWAMTAKLAQRRLASVCLEQVAALAAEASPRPKYLSFFNNSDKAASETSGQKRGAFFSFLSFLVSSIYEPFLKPIVAPFLKVLTGLLKPIVEVLLRALALMFKNIGGFFSKISPLLALIFVSVIALPLLVYYFFIKPLLMLRYLIIWPKFESAVFSIEEIGEVKGDSAYSDVTVQFLNSGPIKVPELSAAPGLIQSGLIETGTEGRWLIISPNPAKQKKPGPLRLAAVEHQGRIIADPEQVPELCGYDKIYPFMAAVDGAVLPLLFIKLTQISFGWSFWLLWLPVPIILCLLSLGVRRRFLAAFERSLKEFSPNAEIYTDLEK